VPTETCWVAVEGCVCAGKTTLSRALLEQLAGVTTCHVKDYADHVGGGRFLPRPVPETVLEDEEALRILLDVETDRLAPAHNRAHDIVIMDRSVYTLLAHRHALERVTGLRLRDEAGRVIARSAAPAWPDLVLYLDVDQQTILDRNRGKFPPDSIFINPVFNAGVRDYYADITDSNAAPTVWLNATLGPNKVASLAEAHITELLHRRRT
jgi:thymidylate kinase